MKKFLLCAIGVVCILIQNSILNYIDIFGFSINLLLIYVVVISLYLDELEAGVIAGALGLISDATVGGVFGINALILFTIGYVIALNREKLYKDSKSTIVVFIIIATLFDSVLNIASSSVLYHHYGIITLAVKGLAVAPVVNAVVGIILYILTRKWVRKLKED
ncbi:MAG: rod shape-determining protein MreD [Clostridioides sp.]|jgi:rod shape-determining protein MreD|nr:rod shape-determining protein MreD [Clostridioides sp.]